MRKRQTQAVVEVERTESSEERLTASRLNTPHNPKLKCVHVAVTLSKLSQ